MASKVCTLYPGHCGPGHCKLRSGGSLYNACANSACDRDLPTPDHSQMMDVCACIAACKKMPEQSLPGGPCTLNTRGLLEC